MSASEWGFYLTMITVEWNRYNYCWNIYNAHDRNWMSLTKEDLQEIGMTPKRLESEFDNVAEVRQFQRDYYEALSELHDEKPTKREEPSGLTYRMYNGVAVFMDKADHTIKTEVTADVFALTMTSPAELVAVCKTIPDLREYITDKIHGPNGYHALRDRLVGY